MADSTGALDPRPIPERLLVPGGGIIGLEMGCIRDALGYRITVVEFMGQIIPGCGKDIVKLPQTRIEGRYESVFTKTKVTTAARSAPKKPESWLTTAA